MCFLVEIAAFFDSKPPVASVDLLFLIKSSVGWFLLKRVDLVIVCFIYTLLVEIILARFVDQPAETEKKLILTVFFDTLNTNISWTVAQTPIRHIIFWKTVIKSFRSIYVNWFNRLRFLAKISTKLQKMHSFWQFKDHNTGRKHGN